MATRQDYLDEVTRLQTVTTAIKDKVREVAENRGVEIEGGVDTILTVLEKFKIPASHHTYGVKIDLTNSNPETALTYTDDAVDFTPSHMDFENDTFVYGDWQDKWPFNEIKPCYMESGVVTKYLNPNNYAEDVDGNAVDITSTGNGDVMIEIPKIYYYLHNDTDYQYIQIADYKVDDNWCCLAHTYKGVEKDKVYIGAYQSYLDSNNKSRSISGIEATGNESLNDWRTYARNQGSGYENFYWDLLILLQSLFVIQFKNLDSQNAMGYGWCNGSGYTTGGTLNTKGMNYCASGTANAQMKWLGIEDFWGSHRTLLDGAYINGTSLTVVDATSPNMAFSGTGVNYITAATGLTTGGGFFTKVIGDNLSGFCPQGFSGSSSTYYCDYGYVNSSCVPYFGGNRSDTTRAGAFYVHFVYNAANTGANAGRLAFCG